MDRLEKFIKENEAVFNDSEPAEGHFKRFSKKLERESKVVLIRSRKNLMLRIAAAILLLITGSAILFNLFLNRLDLTAFTTSEDPGISVEMQNALQYYDGQTDSRLKEFNRLACCGEEQIHLNKLVSSELNAIDANIEELKQGLINDPQNERIQAAIVQNQKMKSQVLDNMIEQMKKVKGDR